MNLLSLLSQILGDHKHHGKGEHYFSCPFCHHHNKKFAVNLLKNKWHCWVCGAKGNHLIGLFKKLDVSKQQIKELKQLLSENDVKSFVETNDESVELRLPNEFKPLWVPTNTFEYTADLYSLGIDNVTSYTVTINGLFYGQNIFQSEGAKIQVNTNDALEIQIVKTDSSKDAVISLIAKLV